MKNRRTVFRIALSIAVAALVHRTCPTLAMHASTQMAIHNLEGARALETLGFSRVVLARELTAMAPLPVHRSRAAG